MDRLFQKPSNSKKTSQNESQSIQFSKDSAGNTTASICKYLENKDIQGFLDRRVEILADKISSILTKIEKDELIQTLQADRTSKEYTAKRIYEIIIKTLQHDQERHLEELANQLIYAKQTNEGLLQNIGDVQKDLQMREAEIEQSKVKQNYYQQQIQFQCQEIGHQQKIISELQDKIDTLNQQITQLNVNDKDFKQYAEEMKKQLTTLQNRYDEEIQEELTKFQNETNKYQLEISYLEKELSQKMSIINKLRKEKDNDKKFININIDKLVKENEQLKKYKIEQEDKFAQYQRKTESLYKQQQQELKSYQESTEEIAKCLQDLSKLKKFQDDEISRLKNQNKQLMEQSYQNRRKPRSEEKDRKDNKQVKEYDPGKKYNQLKRTNEFLSQQIHQLNQYIMQNQCGEQSFSDKNVARSAVLKIKSTVNQLRCVFEVYYIDLIKMNKDFQGLQQEVREHVKWQITMFWKRVQEQIQDMKNNLVWDKQNQIDKLRQSLAESEQNEICLLRVNKNYQEQIRILEQKSQKQRIKSLREGSQTERVNENKVSFASMNKSFEQKGTNKKKCKDLYQSVQQFTHTFK